MSDHIYKIVLSVLIVALIAVAVTSFARDGFSLSPLSILVGFFLLVLPISLFLRFWFFGTLIFLANPDIREQNIKRRRGEPQSTLPLRLTTISFAASHIWLVLLLLSFPEGIESTLFQVLLLPWFGLFMFGAMGLVYTSRWIQTHPVTLAVAGISIFLGGVIVLWCVLREGFTTPNLIFVAIDLNMTGLLMFIAPYFIWFARKTGQID